MILCFGLLSLLQVSKGKLLVESRIEDPPGSPGEWILNERALLLCSSDVV